jgi:hypothetical protein
MVYKMRDLESNELDKPEDEYVDPNGSTWIVSVATDGRLSIMKAPNIHPSFLDDGMDPEYFGMPDAVTDPPGVYEWVCSYSETRDWETGMVDGYDFEPIKDKLLWSLEELDDEV